MDVDKVNEMGNEPILNFLNQLDISKESHNTVDDITNLIAKTHNHEFNALFELDIGGNILNTDGNYLLNLIQPGVLINSKESGLPLSKEAYENKEIISYYKEMIHSILSEVFGDQSERDIEAMTNSIVEFEQKLAKIMLPLTYFESLDDKSKTFQTPLELEKEYPNINWKLYFEKRFKDNGIPYSVKDDTVIVNNAPALFKELNKLIGEIDINTLVNFVKWNMIYKLAPYSADNIKLPYKQFNNNLTGITEEEPLYKTCIKFVENSMGMALGKYYVEKKFNESAKEITKEFFDNLEEAMIERFSSIEWFDDQTREYAIQKVLNINDNNIGFPDYIKDPQVYIEYYKDLTIDTEVLVNTAINSRAFKIKKELIKFVTNENSEWGMNIYPQNVDAYYLPNKNSIIVLAGILQQPFYDILQPDYLNYGAIGSIMGHEITHAFDNNGKNYDISGKLANWWTDSTLSEFEKLTQCFIDQYDDYYIIDENNNEVHADGSHTLNENIADNGGLARGFDAWQISLKKDLEKAKERNKRLPGLSDYSLEQLFFISFGQSWCSNSRTSYKKQMIEQNNHSLPKFRINGSVSNFKAFAEAFNCDINKPMNPIIQFFNKLETVPTA